MGNAIRINVLTGESEVIAVAPTPSPVPPEIRDWQFFQQLAAMGHITEQEALDAVGPGILPASMLALIEALPQAQQFSTKITLTGATTFQRSHPLTSILGGMYGMDEADLDALWTEASTL